MAGETKNEAGKVRAFWSGTVSFGLVSVPVELYPGTRRVRAGLRLLAPSDLPVQRRYYCPEDNRDVHPEHILRGFEVSPGKYVVVRDDELESLEPRKSRDIDLRRFVPRAQLPPTLFDRPYYLTPAGDSTKAYRLLAHIMEGSGRAGIATFVMRGKEYLVAILAENGILCAETLRFADEIRTPRSVGLPAREKPAAAEVTAFTKIIRKHTISELKLDELHDEYAEGLRQLAEKKRRQGEDVVEAPEADEDALADSEQEGDLLATIRRSLQQAQPRKKRSRKRRRATARRR